MDPRPKKVWSKIFGERLLMDTGEKEYPVRLPINSIRFKLKLVELTEREGLRE